MVFSNHNWDICCALDSSFFASLHESKKIKVPDRFYARVKKQKTKGGVSTNMDNIFQSVPYRKLLRGTQEALLRLVADRSAERSRVMWECVERMKGKHSCVSGWYDEALRHLLVQHKEVWSSANSSRKASQLGLGRNRRQAAFHLIRGPRRPAQNLVAAGARRPCDLLTAWAVRPGTFGRLIRSWLVATRSASGCVL